MTFTDKELQVMHRYCLKYQLLLRKGGTPTAMQDLNFMTYQAICYEEGIAYEL